MHRTRALVFPLALLAGVVATGVVGLMWIEGWDLLDAMWMVVITLTTIGFGEIHPLSNAGRMFTLGLIVAGVGVGTYAMSQLTTLLIEGQLPALLRERRRKAQMDRMRNHFIVIGYGRLGKTVADELRAAGVPHCIIEKDPVRARQIEEAQQCPVFVGDGSDDEVLRAAGVERARGVAVAVSSGAEAVYATMSARELNPKLYIVTRVVDHEHAVKARRAGADEVVSPHTMGGWRMAHGLMRPHTSSFLDLAMLSAHPDIQIEEVEVRPDGPLAGQRVRDLHLHDHYGILIIAVRRKGGAMAPAPTADEVLAEGDILIVIGEPGRLREWLGRVAPDQRPHRGR